MAKLSVRPLASNDITLIVNYWCDMSAADLERMGVDATKIPTGEQFTANLHTQLNTPTTELKAFPMIWCVDDEAVGFATLKNISYGAHGQMHLHIAKPQLRGKGYGGTLFCLAALEFYNRFEPQSIICEPRSTNPMPNGMLKRVGFPLLKTYVGKSGDLSLTCELNRYDIRKDIVEEFLRK
jgi:hypothetical protein